MSISSIDDLLMGGSGNQQPMPVEEKMQQEPEPIEEFDDEPDSEGDFDYSSDEKADDEESDEQESSEDDESREPELEEDEYGNKKERMSKGMKERLDRKERQHQREIDQRDQELNNLRSQLAQQGASQPVQQAVKDFEYNPDAAGDWQQQLAQFVRQEVKSMTTETQNFERQRVEQETHREFQQNFITGMKKFDDFKEVVEAQPVDDAMTLALRGMQDPAAFIYAASKRQPQELERISKLRDPYARMVEMGKLEERMRKNKPTTKAPRPLGRTHEDTTTKDKPKQKDTSGDDLLARADAKRLSTVKTRMRGNR